MKWYKASEELPQEYTTLLVASLNLDDEYDEDWVDLVYRSNDACIGWSCGARDIMKTDRWAYIELPEN